MPCSLRELVLDFYADSGRSASGAQAMVPGELIAYLRQTDNTALTPLDSVLAQTEAIGDPALPTPEHVAILHWLGAAFNNWERQFPLEQPLASGLQRLKPLAAVLAITDPDFLTPGKHPLHRTLDCIQQAAVGWQATLGRAGQVLEQQITGTIDKLLASSEAEDPDLEEICSEIVAMTRRDKTRADRMTQRLIETEQGRIKTTDARRRAATMINEALGQFQAPPGIVRILQGPWFESAQLILLKFGPDSKQWSQMSETTFTLLDSVQASNPEDSERRQYFFDIVTRLPRELKRWLLSLQHDSEAVDEAIGVVEFVHLQVLRKQALELEQAEPIPVEQSDSLEKDIPEVLESIEAGQWFQVSPAEGDALRARLVLRMDEARQLLFANQAGLKVLQPGFSEFAELLSSGRAALLDSGASFSRCLAEAAGIKSTEGLNAMPGAAAEQARREEQEQLRIEQERLQREAEEAGHISSGPGKRETNRELEAAKPPPQAVKELEVHLPMGAWLGFHDGEKPLMARLAVHDREQDNFIFVNRSGIKVRELSGPELLALMEEGMVDILESRSNFRDEISRVKNRSAGRTNPEGK